MGRRAELCRIALNAAEEAARLLAEGYRSRPRVSEKAKRDLVTEFDLRSQDLLLQRLAEKAPGVPVVAEEPTEGVHAFDPTEVELAFCVDPLDGTTNFVHGHPFFGVVVGVLERGQPVVGAVVAPALATSWHGYVGEDVRRCGSAALDLCLVADGTYEGYWERRLHVWDVTAGAALVRAAGGRVTALDGGSADWRVGRLVASNGHIHDALVDAVAG